MSGLDGPMVPVPDRGRVFHQQRRVGLADVSPAGRLRFDGIARWLQDISNEDIRDAAFSDIIGWVVRRTVVEVDVGARFGELVDMATFCSGIGPRWAERRVSLTGTKGARIEASTLWVHVDLESQRPKRLPEHFHELFAEAAAGRKVGPKLELPTGPAGDDGVVRQPWPLRFADFDVLGHVNNAAYWQVLEEELSRRRDLRPPMRAAVEFHQPVERGDSVEVTVQEADGDDRLSVWLTNATGVHAALAAWPLPRG